MNLKTCALDMGQQYLADNQTSLVELLTDPINPIVHWDGEGGWGGGGAT